MFLRLANSSDEAIRGAYDQLVRNQLIGLIGYTVVLVAEGFAYWKIRYANPRKGLVWGHLAGWIIASLIMPALYFLLVYWFSLRYSPDNYRNHISSYATLQQGIMWGVLIIGHLCFAMVLVDAYRKKKHPEADTPDDDAENFLNDYKS